MISEKLRNRIGLVALALALLASFGTVATRNVQKLTSDKIEIRIAHSGVREAFEAAIAAYEALHPEVRIVQISVPSRIYPAWSRTQLVSGTAPDIMPLAGTDVEIVQFFQPITALLSAPNPYNEGTSLDGVAWRDTFFDGLSGLSDSMRSTAPDEVFGVTLQTTSMRLFINRDLLLEITGSDALPENYAELHALAEKVRAYNQSHGKQLIPIASCKTYAEYIFDRIVGSQTQTFLLDYDHHMRSWGLYRPLYEGKYSYSKTPEFLSSLEIMSEVAQMLSPGFQQFAPEDAIAAYLQQRSLMLVAGSWDYAVIVDQMSFETEVMMLPVPSTDDPKYGKFTLGQAAEDVQATAALGVVRTSPNTEIAIDFLKFLTSHPGATQFSEISKRISTIIDVPVPDDLKKMIPQIEGEVPGFRVDTLFGNLNVHILIQRHIHKVIGPSPDISGFAETIDAEFAANIREDLKFYRRYDRLNAQRFDATIALHYLFPEDHEQAERADWRRHSDAQHGNQSNYIDYQHYLRPLGE